MGEDKPTNLTYGERAVGIGFNPSGNIRVDRVKKLCAELIDILHDDRGENRDERARHASVAITDLETAQMRAVKALTFDHRRDVK